MIGSNSRYVKADIIPQHDMVRSGAIDCRTGECVRTGVGLQVLILYTNWSRIRVFKNTEFYGGGKTSENSLNEPAELSLRCLAKTENDHVCRCLATLALEMLVSLLEG